MFKVNRFKCERKKRMLEKKMQKNYKNAKKIKIVVAKIRLNKEKK